MSQNSPVSAEKDHICEPPPRMLKKDDRRPIKLATTGLTCSEADVDKLLSEGELT